VADVIGGASKPANGKCSYIRRHEFHRSIDGGPSGGKAPDITAGTAHFPV
jgi:hypothetical protein